MSYSLSVVAAGLSIALSVAVCLSGIADPVLRSFGLVEFALIATVISTAALCVVPGTLFGFDLSKGSLRRHAPLVAFVGSVALSGAVGALSGSSALALVRSLTPYLSMAMLLPLVFARKQLAINPLILLGALCCAGGVQALYHLILYINSAPDFTSSLDVLTKRITLLDPRTTIPLVFGAAIVPCVLAGVLTIPLWLRMLGLATAYTASLAAFVTLTRAHVITWSVSLTLVIGVVCAWLAVQRFRSLRSIVTVAGSLAIVFAAVAGTLQMSRFAVLPEILFLRTAIEMRDARGAVEADVDVLREVVLSRLPEHVTVRVFDASLNDIPRSKLVPTVLVRLVQFLDLDELNRLLDQYAALLVEVNGALARMPEIGDRGASQEFLVMRQTASRTFGNSALRRTFTVDLSYTPKLEMLASVLPRLARLGGTDLVLDLLDRVALSMVLGAGEVSQLQALIIGRSVVEAASTELAVLRQILRSRVGPELERKVINARLASTPRDTLVAVIGQRLCNLVADNVGVEILVEFAKQFPVDTAAMDAAMRALWGLPENSGNASVEFNVLRQLSAQVLPERAVARVFVSGLAAIPSDRVLEIIFPRLGAFLDRPALDNLLDVYRKSMPVTEEQAKAVRDALSRTMAMPRDTRLDEKRQVNRAHFDAGKAPSTSSEAERLLRRDIEVTLVKTLVEQASGKPEELGGSRLTDEWFPALTRFRSGTVLEQLFGIGAGLPFTTSTGEPRTYIHNYPIYVLLYQGVLGFVAYLVLYAVLSWRALICFWKQADLVALAAFATLAAFHVNALFFAVHKLVSFNLVMIMLYIIIDIRYRGGMRNIIRSTGQAPST